MVGRLIEVAKIRLSISAALKAITDKTISNAPDDTIIKEHLKVFADKGIISKYAIPEKILSIDKLPKTSVGKINKKELREKYGDT